MNDKKREEQRHIMAVILSLMIVGLSLLLGIKSDAQGNISINAMIVEWGIIAAIVVYIIIAFIGHIEKSPIRLRFCVNCGRNIPFEAVICPYCRYDYEK